MAYNYAPKERFIGHYIVLLGYGNSSYDYFVTCYFQRNYASL